MDLIITILPVVTKDLPITPLGLRNVRGDLGNSVVYHHMNSPGALNTKAGVKTREHDSRREHCIPREPPGH